MNDFEARLNYKCTFELRCLEDNNQDLLQLCTNKISTWLCKKYKIISLDTPILRAKDYRYIDRFDQFFIHCDHFEDNDDEYALYIIEEPDKKHRYIRTWTTEIGFHMHGKNSLIISFTNYYFDHNDYFGKLPEEPKHTIPTIVKSLLQWESKLNIMTYFIHSDVQISSRPYGYISQSFKHLLNIPKTYGPIFLIGTMKDNCSENFKPIVDPDKLAKNVFGNALVWFHKADSNQEIQNFEIFGKKYSSNLILVVSPLGNGKQFVETIKIKPTSKDYNETEIESILFRIACQHFSKSEYNYVIRKQTIDKLKITRQVTYRMDVLVNTLKYEREMSVHFHELISQNEELEFKNKELTSENDEITQLLEIGDKDCQKKNQELIECKTKIKYFEDIIINKKTTQGLDYYINFFRNGSPNRKELIELFLTVFTNDIERTSELDSNLKDCDSSIDLIWDAFSCLLTYVLPGYRENNPHRAECVKNNSRFELKERESQQTMRCFGKEREGHWNGQTISAEPHLSSKNWNKTNPEKNLRLYFYYDNLKKIIVIHSIGKHLQTEGTKRRKD